MVEDKVELSISRLQRSELVSSFEGGKVGEGWCGVDDE
jgi:hypothetical protein